MDKWVGCSGEHPTAQLEIFYPVKDGMVLQIGDYELRTAYDHGDYKIDIEYVSN